MSGLVDKELRPLLRAAQRAGWQIVRPKKAPGVVIVAPTGERVGLHSSVHGHGANVKAKRQALRRAGLDV